MCHGKNVSIQWDNGLEDDTPIELNGYNIIQRQCLTYMLVVMIYLELSNFKYTLMITRFFGELDGYAALKDDLNGAVNDAYELMKLMKQLKRNLLILPED